jgi:hypothetical protein
MAVVFELVGDPAEARNPFDFTGESHCFPGDFSMTIKTEGGR